jgi:flagellar biosynthesis/type III secretory pathway chaperone
VLNTEKLIRGYLREIDCYKGILELSEKLRTAFKQGRPLEDIVRILNKKKKIMEDVDKIERWMEEEKKSYRLADHKSEDVVTVIGQLSGLIGKILEVERENEILFNSGGRSKNHAGNVVAESPVYALARYSRGR